MKKIKKQKKKTKQKLKNKKRNYEKQGRRRAKTSEQQKWTKIKENALRIFPAVTRLTVYRRLQVWNSRWRTARVRRNYSKKIAKFF